ncbi:MAG: sugar ABC transporter permease [Peptococcaceae bacterium]|jgi:ABC-type sugar transport system permease subunit|nr:sugar ABC transporter permease [Peptococcaceae bacterium]
MPAGRATGIDRTGYLKEKTLGILLVLPTMVIVLLVVVVPLAYAVWISLGTTGIVIVGGMGQVTGRFAGLANYTYFLKDPSFWAAFLSTFYYTMTSLVVELVLGTLIALLLNQDFRGRWLVRAVIIVPWAVPTVVNARLWSQILNGEAYGPLNALLLQWKLVRQPVVWLNVSVYSKLPVLGPVLRFFHASLALNMVLIGDTWRMLPLVVLLILAALQTIPQDYHEAAVIDGANAWQRFWHITYPLLKPIIMIVLVVRTMDLFRVFDILYVILGYGVNVLAIKTFQEAFEFGYFGRGAALAVIVALLILGLTFIYMRILRSDEGAQG